MTKKQIVISSACFLAAIAACASYYFLKTDNSKVEPANPVPAVTEEEGAAAPVISPWETVVKAIQGCEAMEVFQAHNLSVTAKLHDGRELSAVEPAIDDIMRIAAEAESKCGDIVKGTE